MTAYEGLVVKSLINLLIKRDHQNFKCGANCYICTMTEWNDLKNQYKQNIVTGIIRRIIGGIFLSIFFPLLMQLSEVNAQERVGVLPMAHPPYLMENIPWVDSLMRRLSLEEKIAQLIHVRAYSNRDQDHVEEIARLVERYKIGGLVFFQGGPVRQAKLTNYYQSLSDIPLMISQDCEWGLGMRLDSTVSFPKQMMLGAVTDDSLIYEMGLEIARQCKRIGVHVNLAPVVDINNNPANPVIGIRSFGEDRENVTGKGLAYMKGLQDGGVLSTAKHFPGHGDTDSDSHYTLPVIGHDRTRLDSVELYPYRRLIDEGLGGVMVAHLFIRSLDSTRNRPSTLSPVIVRDLLHKEMGFKGLVFTDALDMKGVTSFFEPGEADLHAFLAGNDILLLSLDVPKAIHEIKKAVRHDEFLEAELDKRVRKVLAAKYWMGLNRYKPALIRDLQADLNPPSADVLKSKLVQGSITVLENKESLLPLERLDTLNIASISIGRGEKTHFQEMLELYTDVTSFVLPVLATEEVMNAFIQHLSEFDLVIASIHGTNDIPARRFGITPVVAEFVNRILQRKGIILVVFGNPYCLSSFSRPERASGLIISYEDSEYPQHYSAQVIFGGIPAGGRLPVTANGKYRVGAGIDLPGKTRLSYTIPEEAGLSSACLQRIDSIAGMAIAEKATPGCVVLVSRNGAVVYHKAFGYHTYGNKTPVCTTDLFDIASVTKIAASMPSLMSLYEQGKMDLSQRLGFYLPEIDTTDKGALVIRDVLGHQARLNGWIPFYQHTFDLLDTSQTLFAKRLSDDYPFKLENGIYLNRNYNFRNGIFSINQSDTYPYQVAENMFMNRAYRDTIFSMIKRSALREKKEYRYSDLGFYYFILMIERMTGMSIDRFAREMFYGPLGATTLGYKPLERFDKARIVPTENDVIFRRQLLQGYVHDPGAAMLGGVAGHAGLFSSANDLAKMMQMYLNGGVYGGRQYFRKNTVDLFTTACFNTKENRRALGFDKPEPDPEKEGPACPSASLSSFGHSGFTGTMAWADPETGIVFIFLSNRIHPNQYNNKLIEMNIRTQIQQAAYDALIIDNGEIINPVINKK